MRRDVAASPRRGSHRLSLLTVPRAASREAHCQADRGINLSAVESRKLIDRKYCFIAIGDLFTEKISHAQSLIQNAANPSMKERNAASFIDVSRSLKLFLVL